MKPWQLGDGDNTVSTEQLRMEFIFDSINRQLAAIGVTDQTTFDAFANYIGYSTGGTPSYQDMQVAWTPSNLKLGQLMGFVTYDTSPALPGITALDFTQTTRNEIIDIESTAQLLSVSSSTLLTITDAGYMTLVGNSSLTSVSFSVLGSISQNLSVFTNVSLTSLLLPSLLSTGTTIGITGNTSLSAIDLSSLTTASTIDIEDAAITSLDLSALISIIGASFTIKNNSLLVSILLSSFVVPNGTAIDLSGNALNTACVDALLARFVASAGFVTGTVNLTGGTTSAPTSIAPGSDYAILNGRGVVTTVNP